MIIDTKKNNFLLLLTALLLNMGLFVPIEVTAQLSYHAKNMGLGGGGTAYTTGSEALFLNPANLLIREKNNNISISLLQGSSFLHGINSTDGLQNRLNEYKRTLSPYDPGFGEGLPVLTTEEREEIVNRNFRDNFTNRTFTAQLEIQWFGVKWYGEEKAYALSLRSRVGNRFTLGRGLFSDDIIENSGKLIIDRSFQHIYQVQHELSFGYSESFTFLNGIQPKPSEFLIGIAPKLVIPGSGLNVNATNQFLYQPETSGWIHETEYYQISTGALTEQNLGSVRTFNDEPQQPFRLNHVSLFDLFKPTGIGLGLDIGITYLITLGDDLSILRGEKKVTNQSVRFSFSVTDIGATIINHKPSEINVGMQSSESSSTGKVTEYIYRGAPNEHYFFLNQLGIDIPHPAGLDDQLYTMLPASIQTGVLFHYNRFKLMGDASYSMVDSAFRQSGLISYFGTEIRPFHFLPLRAGTRIGKNLPPLFSFGTGFETNVFDVNVAFMIQTGDLSDPLFSGDIVGMSLLGVKFHL